MSNLTVDDLDKNISGFSITETGKDLIINKEFKSASDDRRSNVFKNLSVISEDIGRIIYENILNYIDNIGNIDLCKIAGMKSQCKMLAIDYSIIDKIQNFPPEIRNMLDIFSINPQYLLSSGFFESPKFDQQFKHGFTQAEYENVVSSCFYNTIANQLSAKYVEYDRTDSKFPAVPIADFDNTVNVIYKNISAELFNENENDLIKADMISSKNKYGVMLDFNEKDIVDNIESGRDSFDNYSVNERHILSIELENRRSYMYVPTLSSRLCMLPTSRFAWYMEKKVKDYIQFILTNNSKNVISGEIYDINNRYVVLSNDVTMSSLIDKRSLSVNVQIIKDCAVCMKDIAVQMCKLRYMIKEIPQKYYIRGSFLLLNHLINETLWQYTQRDAQVQIQEYDDTTEYFNIRTDTTGSAYNGAKAIRPYYKDIVKNGIIDIDKFYTNSISQSTGVNSVSSDLDEFLLDMYKYGASRSYVDRETMELCATSFQNKQIALNYLGNQVGYQPWLNFKNKTHPSYQIHPCLYNLVKYNNISRMIKHSFDSVMNDEYQVNVINDVGKYVGSYGNVLCAWNNGVDEFFGYNSRYEDSPHIARSGIKSAYADYDGLFYDEAFRQFINDKAGCVNSVSSRNGDFYNKYYKHLRMNENEAKYYANIMSAANYNDILQKKIEQYSIDIYHNCYCRLSDKRIWIRFDGHVIPVPLFSSNDVKDGILPQKYSNITFMDFNKDANVLFFKNGRTYYAGKIQMAYNDEKPKFYQYNLYNLLSFQSNGKNIIKYENCIGLLDVSTTSLSCELYSSNSERMLRTEPYKISPGQNFKVTAEFDQIQISYLSAFDSSDNCPYYMKNCHDVSGKSILSGLGLIVDKYEIVGLSKIVFFGREYFQCQDGIQEGLIPVFKNSPYFIADSSDVQMFQLMDGQVEYSANVFPYGRLANYHEYITNLSSNSESYISSFEKSSTGDGSGSDFITQVGCIPASDVSAVSLYENGKLYYVLNNGGKADTAIYPIFQTEPDKYGNNQYVILQGAPRASIMTFENRLSSLVKCSEQDWTIYYDSSFDNSKLSVGMPMQIIQVPSDQYLFNVGQYVVSAFVDTENTIYVNYAKSALSAENASIAGKDVTNNELPANTYLKLQAGMAGILWCGDADASPRLYIKNFSTSEKQRVAIKEL